MSSPVVWMKSDPLIFSRVSVNDFQGPAVAWSQRDLIASISSSVRAGSWVILRSETGSSPAERLQHALIRQRRIGVGGVVGLVLVGLGQHLHQFLERCVVVVVDGGLDYGLDTVVARDE